VAAELADRFFEGIGVLGDVRGSERVECDTAGPVLGVMTLLAVLVKK
jgi:hypothetical protein